MKRRVCYSSVAIIFGVAVYGWLLCSLFLPYTFRAVEYWGLYLDTPDFLQYESFWDRACDWLSQCFYYLLLSTAALALCYGLVFGIGWVLCRNKWYRIVLLVLFLVAPLAYVLHPDVRSHEAWARLEWSAEKFKWNEVLHMATPEACRKDRAMLPYAMLALAETGRLPEGMRAYPVESSRDFDTEGIISRRGYFFKSILYECLGCPNEAVHAVYQTATFLPHGTSFGLLRRMARLYAKSGNVRLHNKYALILSHTSFHAPCKPLYVPSDSVAADVQDVAVTTALSYNVAKLLDSPNHYSTALVHYYLCMLLADGKMDILQKTARHLYGNNPMPEAYKKGSSDNLSDRIMP